MIINHPIPKNNNGQASIKVKGILKGDGAGNIAAAVPGVDYLDKSVAPSIGENGNWFIGSEDTGIQALAQHGENGGRTFKFFVTLKADNWGSTTQVVHHQDAYANGYCYVVSSSNTAYNESQVFCHDIETDGEMVFECKTVPAQDIEVCVIQLEIEEDSVSFALDRIEIETPPDKVEYKDGELFDPAGMVVRAYFSDGTHEVLTGYSYTPKELSLGDTEVAIMYSYRDKVCSAVQGITVVESAKIYGVEWDGTATTVWSRTDDAVSFADPVAYVAGATEYGSPFDDIYPWKGMVRVTDPVAGELVAIPKFYYKWTQNGDGLKLQIASQPVDGFDTSPAHMDRGDGHGERDIVYIGRYHCNSEYKSVSQVKPVVSISKSQARTSIAQLGAGCYQIDFAIVSTIRMLYLVEFANWNSQEMIGQDEGTDSAAFAMGYTDSMPYHTGTMLSSRSQSGVGSQYRYIEGLWTNVYNYLEGCINKGGSLYVTINPKNFDGSDGINIGTPAGDGNNNYCVSLKVPDIKSFTWCLYCSVANTSSGSAKTYITDMAKWDTYSGSSIILFGARYGNLDGLRGLFAFNYLPNDVASDMQGCRLMKLPNN